MKNWPVAFLLIVALVGLRIWMSRQASTPSADQSPAPAEAPPEVKYSLSDLQAYDPLTRMQAARWLSLALPGTEGRPAAADMVPVLIVRLHREHNETVRPAVSWALSKTGTATAPLLLEELRQVNRRARLGAAACFGLTFPAIAGFALQLADERYESQQFVVGVGLAMGQMSQEVLPLLIAALKNPEGGSLRAGAAVGLAVLGSRAEEAVPALVEFLNAEDDSIAGPICHALGQIGRPAVPALRQALKSPDPHVRSNAALALAVRVAGRRFDPTLGEIPSRALEQERIAAKKEAVPDLRTALGDADARVRLFAGIALLDQGLKDQEAALPVLRELMGNADPFVRQTARDKVGELEKARREAGIR